MSAVPFPRFGSPIGPWRSWFAWRPVQTFDGVWCWLSSVKRRRIQKHDYLSGPPLEQWWQYALPADVVNLDFSSIVAPPKEAIHP